MITQFDKTTCGFLGEEVQKALADVAAQHGLVALYDGGKFSRGEFAVRVKFTLSEKNPSAADVERAEFEKYCYSFGLKPEHYGEALSTQWDGFVTLIGLVPSRSRYPVKVRSKSGEIRFFSRLILTRLRAESL